jgi:hypothetical protein
VRIEIPIASCGAASSVAFVSEKAPRATSGATRHFDSPTMAADRSAGQSFCLDAKTLERSREN